MRLVVTVERYAPAIGGAERVAQRISEGLAGRGHEVHVVTGGPRDSRRLGGVQVHRFPVSGNEVRGMRGDAGAALDFIAGLKPDVVLNYAAQTWTTDCCLPLLGSDQGPRMVLAPCGFSGLYDRRYRAYFATMPDRLRRYDALVLHSSVYQDWDFAVRAGATRLVVVPNGADPPVRGDDFRAQLPDGPVAVTVGSHVFSKGHTDFARAIGALYGETNLSGVIVAPPRRGLDGLRGCQVTCHTRARMRPRRLRVVDGSGDDVVAQAVAAADLFLFTSRIECAPLVILEAMAAGTPWVSYEVGNVAELPGGIVADGSADLVAAARLILKGSRPELGPRGREAWTAHHQWPDIVTRYESVFEQVASGVALG